MGPKVLPATCSETEQVSQYHWCKNQQPALRACTHSTEQMETGLRKERQVAEQIWSEIKCIQPGEIRGSVRLLQANLKWGRKPTGEGFAGRWEPAGSTGTSTCNWHVQRPCKLKSNNFITTLQCNDSIMQRCNMINFFPFIPVPTLG